MSTGVAPGARHGSGPDDGSAPAGHGDARPGDLDPRLRAVCDLIAPEVREYAGRHEYDGEVPDYSPAGVRAALGRLGPPAAGGAGTSAAGAGGTAAAGEAAGNGPAGDRDAHDDAHLAVFEDHLRAAYGELELHRRNPMTHLAALDLACYDKEYAPPERRAAARRAHLARWPEAIEAAREALDALSAPVARALVRAVRGVGAALPADAPEADAAAARKAHERLVAHVEAAAEHGDPDAALGAAALSRLMGSAEGLTLELGRLAERADAERDRIMDRLADACARVGPGRPPLEVCRELVRDHPDVDGVIDSSRHWTRRVIAFTAERELLAFNDGECRVALAPESRRWAMAMMTWAAPGEPDGPSWYHITPPDPAWPRPEIDEWLEVFSATTLPAITAHEVAPGHFSHGRALRRAATPVRRTLQSNAFIEGWAHYAEELLVEEGFCADVPGDPDDEAGRTRYAIGVWLEALIRVTRLACAVGVHTGAMSVAEATRRFEADTHITGPAAAAEAERATYDPTYGRYTWGKLAILDLRERARRQWGGTYSHRRFHGAMLELGAPPLGLLGNALGGRTGG